MTFTRSADTYVVHELLRKDDSATPCDPPPDDSDPISGFDFKDWNVLHYNELPGRDIHADDQGLWYDIAPQAHSRHTPKITVNAGSILHRGKSIRLTQVS